MLLARRFDAAAAELRIAERSEPDNPVVLANLGIVLSDGGRPADGVASARARARSTRISTKRGSTWRSRRHAPATGPPPRARPRSSSAGSRRTRRSARRSSGCCSRFGNSCQFCQLPVASCQFLPVTRAVRSPVEPGRPPASTSLEPEPGTGNGNWQPDQLSSQHPSPHSRSRSGRAVSWSRPGAGPNVRPQMPCFQRIPATVRPCVRGAPCSLQLVPGGTPPILEEASRHEKDDLCSARAFCAGAEHARIRAADDGNISGRITDDQNAAVPGVTVTAGTRNRVRPHASATVRASTG